MLMPTIQFDNFSTNKPLAREKFASIEACKGWSLRRAIQILLSIWETDIHFQYTSSSPSKQFHLYLNHHSQSYFHSLKILWDNRFATGLISFKVAKFIITIVANPGPLVNLFRFSNTGCSTNTTISSFFLQSPNNTSIHHPVCHWNPATVR